MFSLKACYLISVYICYILLPMCIFDCVSVFIYFFVISTADGVCEHAKTTDHIFKKIFYQLTESAKTLEVIRIWMDVGIFGGIFII